MEMSRREMCRRKREKSSAKSQRQSMIDPPKREKRGKRKTNRQGYGVQRAIDGRHTGESNSVSVQLLGLIEFLECVASMVCVSACDISKSLSRRCDEFMVSRNRIVVGTTSDMTPPVMAHDLCLKNRLRDEDRCKGGKHLLLVIPIEL